MTKLLPLLLSFVPFVFAKSVRALPFNVRSTIDENVVETIAVSPSPVATPVVDPKKLRNVIRVEDKERVRIMLEGAKLQACQSREEAIKTRQRSLVRLVSGQLKIMDSWIKRLTDFYEEKDLKIDGYNNLLSAVDSARGSLVQSLDEASSLVEDFSCEANDPKGLYDQFRQKMQEVKRYMFEYRKAIRNLLVAIRRVAVGIKPTATPAAEE